MIETKIKGLKILLDDDYIEIIDAYQIKSKQKMIEIIEEGKVQYFTVRCGECNSNLKFSR